LCFPRERRSQPSCNLLDGHIRVRTAFLDVFDMQRPVGPFGFKGEIAVFAHVTDVFDIAKESFLGDVAYFEAMIENQLPEGRPRA